MSGESGTGATGSNTHGFPCPLCPFGKEPLLRSVIWWHWVDIAKSLPKLRRKGEFKYTQNVSYLNVSYYFLLVIIANKCLWINTLSGWNNLASSFWHHPYSASWSQIVIYFILQYKEDLVTKNVNIDAMTWEWTFCLPQVLMSYMYKMLCMATNNIIHPHRRREFWPNLQGAKLKKTFSKHFPKWTEPDTKGWI